MNGFLDRLPTSIACFVVCALALVACSSEESKARGEYLAGCMQSGTGKAACDCTYDQLLKIYPFQQLKAMSKSPGRIPPDFFDKASQAVMTCQKEPAR